MNIIIKKSQLSAVSFVITILVLLESSSIVQAAPGVRARPHTSQNAGQFEMISLPDVSAQYPRNPSYSSTARYEERFGRDSGRGSIVYFADRAKNGITFRDEAAIRSDFQTLIASSHKVPGTTRVSVPQSLKRYTPADQAIYLDTAGKTKLQALGKEMDEWNHFYKKELASTGGAPIITGADILPNATAKMLKSNARLSSPTVSFEFSGGGRRAFRDYTTNHVGKLTAILFNGHIIETPLIEEPITDGSCMISGGLANLGEAQNLANYLNSAAQ